MTRFTPIDLDSGERLELVLSDEMYNKAMSTNSTIFVDIRSDDGRVFVVRKRENGASCMCDCEVREVLE